jgi:hypothetical protein
MLSQSWVRLDELNVFTWPGYDLWVVPGTSQIDHGPLHRPFFERVRRGIVELASPHQTDKP